jgi:predicted amidohydrolase
MVHGGRTVGQGVIAQRVRSGPGAAGGAQRWQDHGDRDDAEVRPVTNEPVRRVAAVQMHAVLGDVDANLERAARGVADGVREGARWIVLPEFFTSGVAFLRKVAAAAQPVDGSAVSAMRDWAKEHGVVVTGSLMLRDPDGEVRNAQLVVDGSGIVARHDKDMPTMWENALYIGGSDDGVVSADGVDIGLAMCWELTRRRTVERMAGRVDIVLAGSGWWSVPRWWPRPLFDRWERQNATRAAHSPASFARYIGAPVVHAAHSGTLACPMPWLPMRYSGRFEPATGIWAANGAPLARAAGADAQVVVADVPLGRVTPVAPPKRYWLTKPGPLPTFAWHQQRWHGQLWYARHQSRKLLRH